MALRMHFMIVFGLFAVLCLPSAASAQDALRLKPGARGEVCLGCHGQFKDKLDSAFVHTPVKLGECSGCHNPHASAHGKLLEADTDKICAKCHAQMVPEGAHSAHEVVVSGNCVSCHDPHASDNKANLVRAGSDLCFGCHAEMGERVPKVKFAHAPVQTGCLSCHNPHASQDHDSLLAQGVPALCVTCHQTDKPVFKKQHMDYPVADTRCTSCHDAHGSDTPTILYANVHQPVDNKMCNQCHDEPTSATPFKLQREGFELCRGCHYDMVNETLIKKRLHWPLVGEEGCVSCHTPHASSHDGLLKESMIEVCGQCHADTIERQERSQTKHVPIAEGQCTTCHSPHGSDSLFMFTQGDTVELCGTCHDWQRHSTHPIGEDHVDPRNKNLTLQCLSCHRSHGTEYTHMLYFETVTEMCIQCHVQFRR